MTPAVLEAPLPQRQMPADCTEDVLTFDCADDRLIGVLSTPPMGVPESGTAMVIVVGGPQYRVGAHRQFVRLARALAADGHCVLRFDVRGMGDSTGAQRGFEELTTDIVAAVDALRAHRPSIRRLALFGLCDGASAVLLCLGRRADIQVDGVCLLNPWVRSEATLARTHLKHYYWHRLADRDFWVKLVAGGIGTGQLRDFARSWRLSRAEKSGGGTRTPKSFQTSMAFAWRSFGGRVLLLLSEDDLTAREFIEHAATAEDWRGLLDTPRVQRVVLAGADHTVSSREAQRACEDAVRGWLGADVPTQNAT